MEWLADTVRLYIDMILSALLQPLGAYAVMINVVHEWGTYMGSQLLDGSRQHLPRTTQ